MCLQPRHLKRKIEAICGFFGTKLLSEMHYKCTKFILYDCFAFRFFSFNYINEAVFSLKMMNLAI